MVPTGWMPTDFEECYECRQQEPVEWTNVDGRFIRKHGTTWRAYSAFGYRMFKDFAGPFYEAMARTDECDLGEFDRP
jgi:hypothetical protein